MRLRGITILPFLRMHHVYLRPLNVVINNKDRVMEAHLGTIPDMEQERVKL